MLPALGRGRRILKREALCRQPPLTGGKALEGGVCLLVCILEALRELIWRSEAAKPRILWCFEGSGAPTPRIVRCFVGSGPPTWPKMTPRWLQDDPRWPIIRFYVVWGTVLRPFWWPLGLRNGDVFAYVSGLLFGLILMSLLLHFGDDFGGFLEPDGPPETEHAVL